MKQPEALRLANKLDFEATTADMGRPPEKNSTKRLAANELRRLHDFEEQHRAIDECWIREIAAVKQQRDALLEALRFINSRLQGHPAYDDLTEEQEIEEGGDMAEFSYLSRVAREAIEKATGVKE